MKYFIVLFIFFIPNMLWAQEPVEEPSTFSESNSDTSPIPVENDEQQTYLDYAQSLWSEITQHTGELKLPGAPSTLNVPDNFYFIDANDSKKILVDLWGNPPDDSILGMIFPAGSTPLDIESWGVTISYTADGYVSDEDAGKINYKKLLKEMKKDTLEQSNLWKEQGYGGIELIGWASEPYYDEFEHKLHWAKELWFEGSETNTLNYDIRVLGRRGVLTLSFISTIDQLEDIQANLDTVLNIPSFDQGETYSDFNPEIDKVAAYGIGALVAGKVIAKTGLIATLLIILKKFGIFILIGIAALWRMVFAKK